MHFDIIGPILDEETIGSDSGIREIARVRRVYGRGHWYKRKGTANVRLLSGTNIRAEIHWYETQGMGKREFSIKRILEG
jgi:hypothetical protein